MPVRLLSESRRLVREENDGVIYAHQATTQQKASRPCARHFLDQGWAQARLGWAGPIPDPCT